MAITQSTPATATTPAVAADPSAAATAAAPFKYDEDRHFFGANELEKCNDFAQKISDSGVRVVMFEGDWPASAGAAVLPIARNETSKVTDPATNKTEEVTARKLFAVLVWPIYGLEALQSANGGVEYLASVILADQAARILNPLRRQQWEKPDYDWNSAVSSCPKSMEEHIEGMQGDRGVIKPYLEAAKIVLPKLKEKWPKVFGSFTPALMRTFLQSKAAAKAFSAALEEKGTFLKVIDALEKVTKEAGGNIEIYQRWRDTRDQEADISVDDVSLDSISL